MNDNQNLEQNSNAAVELGRKLREARQKKGFSIGEVAERLKLPARQIESLESGNHDNLPEPVFVRGFLRTYGRFLDLDSQEVSDYLDRIAPQERSNVYAVERKKSESGLNYQQTTVRPSLPKWLIGLFILGCIGGGIYAWQSKSNMENAKQINESVGVNEVVAPNLQASNVSIVAMDSSEQQVEVAPLAASAASSAEATTASASAALVSASSAVAVDNQAASSVDGVAADELVVKVRYRSNLVIKDKEGQFVVNKIVPAGSEHRFKGGAPYDVWIGYALGATANYGGKEISVSANMVSKKTSSFKAGQ
ncbi:helix-turn-helix domain-containing protein [Neisseria weaveri]|uniref:helix-turn-helix domain-containing protein n=1 Tax=Neisseria weaveri TaxID=28091 RepID=UPI0007C9C582|nr:helix-turn-helix domain-containing protein [Neisseria weaveri]SAY50492.1 Cytoskeleton protein rodZ [Neisseria weaveri]